MNLLDVEVSEQNLKGEVKNINKTGLRYQDNTFGEDAYEK